MKPQISDKLNRNSPIEFVSKTYDIVDDPTTDAIISWTESNNSFVIWQSSKLEKHILRMRFKHKKFSSFVRQLNNYGFKKVDHDRCEYAHKDFLRGQKHLLTRIRKQESGKVQKQQQQSQGQSSVGACVEVGKFGLEEEMERLKRDKNVLMQEVVRLRQQQQSTDLQLQTLGQRLQGMELQQQQMMSFFAKAMQSPGFLAQLVQQTNENINRRIAGVNKKRRLPNLEDGHYTTASDGQIIRYQPLLNEAAQAMLMQPNLASPSHRLDVDTNGDGISIDDISSPSRTQLDSESTSNRTAGFTLLEVAPTSGHSLLSISSGMGPSASIPEIQSSGEVIDTLTTTRSPLTDMSFLDALEKDLMQDMELENEGIEIHGADLVGRGTGTGELYNDSLGVDDTISPFGSGQFSPDIDVDTLVDEYTTKPPATNDSFWEQFLTGHQQQHQKGWYMDGEHHNMDPFTQQMGIFTSEIDVAV
ncbi:hypothetical protein MKX03_009925 [Papaver bracteatum]|nr:hypothetical protein MKX03_009925 [Papaver bracteatum]